MKIQFPCRNCGACISTEATPLPPEQTAGRAGFLEYDVDCPACGENWEGVLGPAEGKEAL